MLPADVMFATLLARVFADQVSLEGGDLPDTKRVRQRHPLQCAVCHALA